MYPVYDVFVEECVGHKCFVILVFVAVNVARPCLHSPSKKTLWYQVSPHHPHKVAGAVADILCRGHDVEPLVQDISRLFFGHEDLYYLHKEFDAHRELLRIFWSG